MRPSTFNWDVLDIVRVRLSPFKWIELIIFFFLLLFSLLSNFISSSFFVPLFQLSDSLSVKLFNVIFFSFSLLFLLPYAADRIVWNNRTKKKGNEQAKKRKLESPWIKKNVSKGRESFWNFPFILVDIFIVLRRISGRWYVNFSMYCCCSEWTIDRPNNTKLYLWSYSVERVLHAYDKEYKKV